VQIQVPASLDEAISNLNGLAALLTAKQWERAAIVYAFTEPGSGGPRTGHDQDQLSFREFADLNIAGLRSKSRVQAYRGAWQAAIDRGGAKVINPGDATSLPELPWEDFFVDPAPTPVVQESAFRAVVRDPERFREALRDEPEIAVQLARQVVDTPAVRFAVEERLSQPVPRREEADYGEPTSRDVSAGIEDAMEEWRKENAWRATMEALKYVTPLQRFSSDDVARDTPADDWEHTKNSLERAAALLGSFAARLAERSLRKVE
jgi:hypothetical protein